MTDDQYKNYEDKTIRKEIAFQFDTPGKSGSWGKI